MYAIRHVLVLGLVSIGFGIAAPAESQIGRRIRDTATRAAEREALRQVDRKVTETVRCALEDQECVRRAEAEGKQVEVVGGVDSSGGTAAASPGAPGAGAWANYDFVPGERLLFADDFSRDNVGDFPRRLEMIQGAMEVVELRESRYLRATSPARFAINLPENLPERFTAEFTVHLGGQDGDWHQVYLVTAEPRDGYRGISVNQGLQYPHSYIQVSGHFRSGVRGGSGGEALAQHSGLNREFVPVRIMADGAHVKVFLGERRVANVPNADLRRSRKLAILIGGSISPERPVFIGDLRIAAGGRNLYDALAAEGRVATQGILFATGSDRIRPESTPTLKEIGEMLREHPQLRIRIEGHTDNVGDAAGNQALSERRAAAVRQHLVGSYGIDASRLESQGLGASRPAVSNGTAEGRQQNRRVELVRL